MVELLGELVPDGEQYALSAIRTFIDMVCSRSFKEMLGFGNMSENVRNL